MNVELKKRKNVNKKIDCDAAQDFIASGVACYAFSLVDELGLLDQLLSEKILPHDFFLSYPNPLAVRTAIRTLECNNIIYLDEKSFRLTPFGRNLAQHRGSIGLIYNGYRKVLANQLKIAQDQPSQNWDLIDARAISRAASDMGGEFFNDLLLSILRDHSITGTICDLGCGNASTLLYLCRKAKLSGLGFDLSSSSIDNAKKRLNRNDKIELFAEDILNINETYPEVEVLLQSFVMHDFSNSICRKTFKSLRAHFPNVRIFIYLDAVSPEDENLSQLPGFDYIHGLLGIRPRTFTETLKLFDELGFSIISQEPILGLTNCHIWTLKPSKQKKREC